MALSLLLRLPSLAQEDRKTLRDSLKLAMEQLSYHPDSVDLRLRKAAWNMQLGEWQYAKDEYDWVINHHPDNLAARYYRAYANTQLRRYNFARLDYENVLRVVPGNFDARLGLALLNQTSASTDWWGVGSAIFVRGEIADLNNLDFRASFGDSPFDDGVIQNAFEHLREECENGDLQSKPSMTLMVMILLSMSTFLMKRPSLNGT